jgi:hypothetical protein
LCEARLNDVRLSIASCALHQHDVLWFEIKVAHFAARTCVQQMNATSDLKRPTNHQRFASSEQLRLFLLVKKFAYLFIIR